MRQYTCGLQMFISIVSSQIKPTPKGDLDLSLPSQGRSCLWGRYISKKLLSYLNSNSVDLQNFNSEHILTDTDSQCKKHVAAEIIKQTTCFFLGRAKPFHEESWRQNFKCPVNSFI